MIVSEESKQKLRAILAVIEAVPEGEFVYINDGQISMAATTQAELRKFRSYFRGTFWKKTYQKWCNAWLYQTTISGVDVTISCQEQPPTCEKIETKKIVRKRVPVTFEEQDVEEIEVAWRCGPETDPTVDETPSGDIEAIAGADHADDIPY
jgi:hypothetical protein